MDPKSPHPAMMAPGASSSSPLHCPRTEDPWPPVDDHLVEPEVTRDEMIRGRKILAVPALDPHADQQSRLDYLVNAHVRPGYVVSTELLTRVAPRSDFATDVCIRQAGTDPKTRRRYLEEVAFEVVSEQGSKEIMEKAEDMAARGVRRVFGVFVKTGEVKEWRGGWQSLPAQASIEDATLARPMPVKAVLNAAETDNAVARALVAKGNPYLAEREQQTLLAVLAARGIAIPGESRARILQCMDTDTLRRWIVKASVATSLQDVL